MKPQENIVLVQVGLARRRSGWQEEEHFHPDFANAVKLMGYNWSRPGEFHSVKDRLMVEYEYYDWNNQLQKKIDRAW